MHHGDARDQAEAQVALVPDHAGRGHVRQIGVRDLHQLCEGVGEISQTAAEDDSDAGFDRHALANGEHAVIEAGGDRRRGRLGDGRHAPRA
jgi:hypothetical protein